MMADVFEVSENASYEVAWTFTDAAGGAINSAALSSVVLTLYDVDTDAIINSRDNQDVLGGGGSGANNVAITAGGAATWYMQPLDNPIIGSATTELHTALIEWTWDPGDGNGLRGGNHEVQFLVGNLHRVP